MSQSRETNEKISDAGRNLYEKQTGYVLPLLNLYLYGSLIVLSKQQGHSRQVLQLDVL
jgi:hypothetical protein